MFSYFENFEFSISESVTTDHYSSARNAGIHLSTLAFPCQSLFHQCFIDIHHHPECVSHAQQAFQSLVLGLSPTWQFAELKY